MRRKFKFILKIAMLGVLFAFTNMLYAQRNITGLVKDAKDGSPIPGVNVLVKGTSVGAVTDGSGNFQIAIPSGSNTLVVSSIGYKTQEVTLIDAQTSYELMLEGESQELAELVVTALGIERKSKTLTYSTQQVNGNELSRSKDVNLINSLAGKSAGVVITKSSSGVGGSSKITIRGNRSASGSNQPLYVIDGIPMYNGSPAQSTTSIGGTNDAGNRDGGDGISNLNPDDIESLSILKGASASALYGSQAANGVIVITTKKGKAGVTNIVLNSSTTFEKSLLLPELQTKYGESSNGESWGTATSSSSYNPKDYFQTGVNAINSVSISSGNENLLTYFSYANTSSKGIVPDNTLAKHNFNLRATSKIFDGKVTLDGSVNYVAQKVENRPIPGGYYFNPLVGLYRSPRGLDLGDYKDNFEVFSADRNMNVQNWHKALDTWEQNPWWLTYRVPSEDKRSRIITTLSADIKINDELKVKVRGNVDRTMDNYEQRIYATTTPALSAMNGNGRFVISENQVTQMYGDAIVSYNKKISDFSINASVGSSINDVQDMSYLFDSRPTGLNIPNVFSVGNMLGIGYSEESKGREQTQSVFGTAQFGYKDYLFLDVTGRNDWSSALAYTNSMKKGFFYPSVGLTLLVSEMLNLPEQITFAKVRGSYSSVGNTIPRYLSYPTHTTMSGQIIFNSEAAFKDLKPEISSSMEFGTEMRFLKDMLSFDFTYYKTNTKNQFFRLPAPAGSGYSWYYVNSGDIENKGIELVLGIHPISSKDLKWKNYLNFSQNKNKVIKLHEELEYFNFGNQTTSSYWMRMEEGGEYGDIYGVAFARNASGDLVLDGGGLPTKTTDFVKIANVNPKFSLSWNASVSYKNFDFNFLIDGRFGGDVIDMTQADLDAFGVSKASADARNKGYVEYGGHQFTNVEGFYKRVGNRDGISEYYVYDATNIRLRELAIAYNLPTSILSKTGFVKGATVSVTGRNLFFIYKNAPFDPDATLSTSNNLQGVNVFGMPTTRSIGFNVKLSF